MQNYNLPPGTRFVEERIPISERVVSAVLESLVQCAVGIALFVLLPVNFFRILCKSTRKVLKVDLAEATSYQYPPPLPPTPPNPDDGEDWKRAHREQYGDE